ncbi:hypothetical protein AHF37_03013 [Paragonimus kellicotti]|nr:hypothetical protein AHF37_03013 [Paragonimus kellicotti]
MYFHAIVCCLFTGLPFELSEAVYQNYPWRLGTTFCRIRIFLTELSPIVSVLILTIFSVERYLSICHPFRRKLRWNRSTTESGSHQSTEMNTSNTIHETHLHAHQQNNVSHGIQKYVLRRLPQARLHNNSLKSCIVVILCMWFCAALCAIPITGLSEAFVWMQLPDWESYANRTTNPLDTCSDDGESLISYSTEIPETCLQQVDDLWTPGEPLTDTTVCAPSSHSKFAQYLSIPLVLQLSSCFFFATPMLIMTVVYSRIALRLRRSNLSSLLAQNECTSSARYTGKYTVQEQMVINSRKGITRMLVVVVVAFFVCWAPFHLQRIITVSGVQICKGILNVIFYLSGTFYYISSTVNPVLYSLMSVRFRRGFKAVFCSWRSRAHRTPSTVGLKVTYHPRSRVSQPNTSQENDFCEQHVGASN